MEFTMRNHMTQSTTAGSKGFAMLFTVLIVSLILSIAISISNLTLKQAVLSNLAKDSQIAFYQADTAVECGLYMDTTLGLFPRDVDPASDPTLFPDKFDCGGKTMVRSGSVSTDLDNYFLYEFADQKPSEPCFTIAFDKIDPTPYKVMGYGYNVCNQDSPRQVERALEVKY